ncbi:hypothetical protein [Pseudarthrobacter sp. PS3-L1]|uniref:hypothetical protein n=1 Tax=Pseudarthrobacter sp. PS3-L1 TaxID=3046207 RepID=UPI0024BA2ED6|nr:hypothetical protein [Pseudarthrobacter sp. PS3-L1]MDJ0321987.1 hypothetical protein [Pseudarthrobacter sp. PS3-L1]
MDKRKVAVIALGVVVAVIVGVVVGWEWVAGVLLGSGTGLGAWLGVRWGNKRAKEIEQYREQWLNRRAKRSGPLHVSDGDSESEDVGRLG